MQQSAKQLLHLPVETEGGTHLGEISRVNIDVERHIVSNYIVKSSLLPRLFAEELMIAPSQVVSITAKKMTVEDSVVPAATPAAATPA